MEGGRFQPDSTMLSTLSDTPVDFDIMDDLGCWLEIDLGNLQATDFLQPGTSNSTSFFNSSYLFPPTSEITDGRLTSNPNPNPNLNPNPPQNDTQQESERSVIPKTPSSMEPHTKNSAETRFLNRSTIQIVETSGQSECHQTDGNSELSQRWWIGPEADTSHVSSVKNRLYHALSYVQDFIRNGDALVQIWVPTKRDGKNVLITDNQPFTISPTCQGLASYRTVSINYQFPADEDSKESVGLPGRVFLGKVPEWTPDVRFFSSDEYPRIDYAQQCDVRGTLAIPIFEHGSRSCLGVVEVVMTTQKLNYRLELENVCKALEAVDLRGPEVSSIPQVKARISYQAVLPEILEVLGAVCEAHRLPLAQTWVPCIQQDKVGCRHSDENYANCVSTVDSACYVTDPQIWDFHGACSEHHLFRGQGIAGRAFITNQPCFSSDITTFSKKDYPLSHYAKMFGLRAAVAIRLRSIYTGEADYVLEFFLPVDCRDNEEQKKMLNSLSIIIQRVCRSLRVVTDMELEEGTDSRVSEVIAPSDGGPKREETKISGPAASKVSSQEESSWFAHMMDAQRKGKHVQKEEPGEGFKVTTHWDSSPEAVLPQGQTFTDFKQHHSDSGHKDNVESGADSSFGDRKYSSSSKAGEKRRTKMEKTISLQVLRQYFAGSLKDAAKNIGVCPTTLKRICRQHGITRWPSRKIKKVGHSLRKLQVVIDSVQGAEGAFQIGSIYANFPELTSPNLSGTNPFSALKPNDQLKPLNTQPEGVSSPQAAASNSTSSSCSQSSSSSLCFSGGKHQQSHITHLVGNEDASVADNRGAATLKRARSDAELHYNAQEEPKILTRSHSQKFPSEHPHNDENLPPLPKSGSRASRDKGGLRVKVSYGEEKVRFSLRLHWDFKDIQQEIAKRFHIDDMSKVDLKYLDDDAEWVLLTCDADLEECMDIYKSSRTHTIKLTVHQVPQPNLGSSFGSSTPS